MTEKSMQAENDIPSDNKVQSENLVEIDKLVVQFKTGQEVNTVVNGVSLEIRRGETLA